LPDNFVGTAHNNIYTSDRSEAAVGTNEDEEFLQQISADFREKIGVKTLNFCPHLLGT
jgi:hypothetical protein